MYRKRNTRLVALACGILVCLVSAASAAASSGHAASTAASVTVSPRPSVSAAQANAFWTQSRIQAAQDAPLQVTDPSSISRRAIRHGKLGIAGLATTSPSFSSARATRSTASVAPYPSSQTPFPVNSQGWVGSANYPAYVGRLYFTEPNGQGYQCTATVVDTNIVLTAGHCGFTAGVGANSNFVFVPAKQGTSEPYGRWTRGVAISYTSWSSDGFYPQDYAFVKFPPSNGRNLASTVGSVSFMWNAPTVSYQELGYPATGLFAQWGGQFEWQCNSPYGGSFSPSAGWYTIGIGCEANGGTSGGPWFEYSNGAWRIASVTSTCWNNVIFCNDPTAGYSANLWGAYFTSSVNDLFLKARQLVVS